MPISSEIQPITSPALGASPHIKHGFFTRAGGVSKGIYEGLNVGVGSEDNQSHVTLNREKIAEHFSQPLDNLVTLYQVHSPTALVIDAPLTGERPKADAIVTNKPDLIAGILTADCGPVIFADPKAGVIGAAHAGWQGATGGVLESSISEMEKLGAHKTHIKAVLGPTISQKNYEVGPEFVDRLIEMSKENAKWLVPSTKPDHAMFDLPGYIVERLNRFGVEASWTGHCTYEKPEHFFSYRRKTHLGEPDYGRQISAISLQSS